MRIQSSLAFKLNIATLSASIIILVLTGFAFNHISQKNIKKQTVTELRYITDTLIIAAETNNEESKISRVVSALAARSNVIHLSLIHKNSKIVIADNNYSFMNEPFIKSYNAEETKLLDQYYSSKASNTQNFDQGTYWHQIVQTNLIDSEINRLRPYLIFISYDKRQALQSASDELTLIIEIYCAGLFFMLLASYLIQHRILLKPLSRIIKTIQKQQQQDEILLLPMHSNDELGRLSYHYNDLNKANENRELLLKETRKYIDGITDEVPVLLAYIDQGLRFQFVNKNFERWFDIPTDKFKGLDFYSGMGEEFKNNYSDQEQQVFSGKSSQFEAEITLPDTSTRHTNISYTPDISPLNEVVGFYICIEDTSKTKEAEKTMSEYAMDLEFKSWALEEEKEKAELATISKSQFLASMSHEIRTPINGVIGMISLLERSDLNRQQQHYASLASSSATTLLTLINDILDFSKIEAGKLELEFVEFDLFKLLGDTIESIAPLAHKKNIDLILDTTELNQKTIISDSNRTRQIISNLLSNSIKFTENGEVHLKAWLQEKSDGSVFFHCSVRDSGIGIPEDKLAQLFDSFTQADASTTREYGGTGLGLAIVKQLCELLGGTVQVSSELGTGSTFSFFFKVSKTEQKQDEMPLINAGSQKILLIDNLITHNETLALQLKNWGAKTTTASSGEKALEILATGFSPTLIFISEKLTRNSQSHWLKQVFDSTNPASCKIILMKELDEHPEPSQNIAKLITTSFPKPATFADLSYVFNYIHQLETGAQTLNHNAEISEPATNPDNWRSSKFILLVEDNLVNQEVALGLLEDMGINLEIANNGQEAMTMIAKPATGTPFDLILMDCQMPVMDGYEATHQIRAGKAGSNNSLVPIIAMTANAMKGDRERCLNAGMNAYLTKPIDPDQLEATIEQYLSPQATATSSPNKPFSEIETAPIENQSNDLAIWDYEATLKRVKNKPERLVMLTTIFLEEIPSQFSHLKKAVNDQDAEAAKAAAHAIKGAVSNMGGLRIQSVSQEMEQQAIQGNINEFQALWPILEQNYQEFKNHIELWLEKQQKQ